MGYYKIKSHAGTGKLLNIAPLGRFLDVKIQIFGMNPARLTRLGRLRLLGTISKLRLSIIFLIC